MYLNEQVDTYQQQIFPGIHFSRTQCMYKHTKIDHTIIIRAKRMFDEEDWSRCEEGTEEEEQDDNRYQ